MSEKDRPYPRKHFPALYCTIYPMLCEIARERGSALAVHGSLGRDMDLIAAPWTEEADEPQSLIDAMIAGTAGLLQQCTAATNKPYGRVCYNIELTAGAYLDVSILPKAQDGSKGIGS